MRRLIGTAVLALAAMTANANAQAARPAVDGPAVQGSSAGAGAVIHPAPTIDPGMKVIRPRVPPASTPVIRPKATTRDGTVVVPK